MTFTETLAATGKVYNVLSNIKGSWAKSQYSRMFIPPKKTVRYTMMTHNCASIWGSILSPIIDFLSMINSLHLQKLALTAASFLPSRLNQERFTGRQNNWCSMLPRMLKAATLVRAAQKTGSGSPCCVACKAKCKEIISITINLPKPATSSIYINSWVSGECK